jgi:hypothetical protein
MGMAVNEGDAGAKPSIIGDRPFPNGTVVPAKAGIQGLIFPAEAGTQGFIFPAEAGIRKLWIPACAGMTV